MCVNARRNFDVAMSHKILRNIDLMNDAGRGKTREMVAYLASVPKYKR